MKWCPRCQTSKQLEEFPLDKRRGRYGYCKPCKADYMRERSRMRTSLENFHHNLSRSLRQNGLTIEDYRRMSTEQEGRCAICRTDVPGQNAARLILDHDHKTGVVRGLLCSSCNRGLGYFADSPERLLAAASYLKR